MGREIVIDRILDGEHVIAELDRFMSRDQVKFATNAGSVKVQPGTPHILDGSTYRPIVAGDIAGLAANTNTVNLLCVNYYRYRTSPTKTVRAAAHLRTCRLNAKKYSGIDALTATQKTALNTAMARQGIQSGF